MRAAVVVAIALAPALCAGPAAVRSFADMGSAPAYVVCRVDRVAFRGASAVTYYREYELHGQVLRAFPEMAATIVVRYRSAEDPLPWNASGSGGAGPPEVVKFEPGQIALLGIAREDGAWRLREWIPATAGAPGFGGIPKSGRDFFLREMVQTLTRAPAVERVQAARFLLNFAGWVPAEVPQMLGAALGRDDDAWLETGCAFLGVLGRPWDDPAALTYGEASPPFDQGRKMATWILWKGDRRDYPNRLIRCLLRNAGAYRWGASMALIQYKDSTVLIDGVNADLRRGKAGSLSVAYQAVKAGQRAVLPEALSLAVKMVRREVASGGEIQTAAQLLVNYGDEQQFGAMTAALRRFQREDENFYRELWGAAAYGQNRRELALAAVLIGDKRWGFHTLRYCDVAAGVVQRFSGQNFGRGDAAVARAAVWLAARPHQ